MIHGHFSLLFTYMKCRDGYPIIIRSFRNPLTKDNVDQKKLYNYSTS